MIAASAVGVEFSVQPCDQLQRFENGSGSRQSGPNYLPRCTLSGFVEEARKCGEDRVPVALCEPRSPRPPLRIAGLTWFPGAQIPETRRLWHQFGDYDNITVPSLLSPPSARWGDTVRYTELADRFKTFWKD
jgi:hypothetical protein